MAVTLAYCIYLSYLLSIYGVRQGKLRGIRSTLIPNHFGAATTLAAFLLVWGGLSLLWTPAPKVAVAFYLVYLAEILISYMLCKLYPIRDVLRSVCKGTAYAAAAATPLAIVLIGYSGGRLGENSVDWVSGRLVRAVCLGALSVLYLVHDRAMSKRTAIFLMISLICGLLLAFSKGYIIAFAVAAMVYAWLAPGSLRRRLARIALLAVGIVIAWISSASRIAAYMSKSEIASTLTGRTVLWAQTYAQIINGPWIRGFGFFAFWAIGPVPWQWHGAQNISGAHNEFLNVWFNFGLVGVALVFGSYFALGYASLKAMKRGGGFLAVLVLCVVVFYLIAGIATHDSIFCLLPIPWLLLFDCLVSTFLAGGGQRSCSEKVSYEVR